MAISTDAGEGPAALARRQAQAILAESRFHVAPIPRPLHGVLHAIGALLESPLNALEELVSGLASGTPGGSFTIWAVLAALVLALSTLLSARGARRALGELGGQRASRQGESPLTAADLEREALAAEGAGRHGDAVRWRFRAGLMRLSEDELVADAPSMVNAQVSRALHSQRFDTLARRFDEIAYGGRAAAEEDVERSRREWSELLRSERDG
jgi:hypothetical protein